MLETPVIKQETQEEDIYVFSKNIGMSKFLNAQVLPITLLSWKCLYISPWNYNLYF